MKKKLAFITAAMLLMSAGCGNIDNGNDITEEDTTAAEETETTTEEETTEEVTEEEETTAEETTEVATETETAETPANVDTSNYFKVLTDIEPGMTKDEVFAIIGDDYTYEEEYLNSMGYIYPFESDDIFGTGLKGDMFVEFNFNTDTFRCGGFHLGATGTGDNVKYPYSEAELSEAYDKIMPILKERFGSNTSPIELNDNGIRGNAQWTFSETEDLWAMWGVGLWGENSPVNEILISHAVEY